MKIVGSKIWDFIGEHDKQLLVLTNIVLTLFTLATALLTYNSNRKQIESLLFPSIEIKYEDDSPARQFLTILNKGQNTFSIWGSEGDSGDKVVNAFGEFVGPGETYTIDLGSTTSGFELSNTVENFAEYSAPTTTQFKFYLKSQDGTKYISTHQLYFKKNDSGQTVIYFQTISIDKKNWDDKVPQNKTPNNVEI